MDNLLGIILSISFSSAYIPQIIKMIKRKSSNDISLIMLLVNGLGYMSGVGYVILKNTNAFWLTFNYLSGFFMTLVCIGFWSFYRKNN